MMMKFLLLVILIRSVVGTSVTRVKTFSSVERISAYDSIDSESFEVSIDAARGKAFFSRALWQFYIQACIIHPPQNTYTHRRDGILSNRAAARSRKYLGNCLQHTVFEWK